MIGERDRPVQRLRGMRQHHVITALGIEQEDYNLAIARHCLEEDEYVHKRNEEVERRVSEELRTRLIEPLFQNPQEDDDLSGQISTQMD